MSNKIFSDYYEDLQISPNADSETINRVYRLLARKWHPDNNQTGDTEKFNIINEAYHVLTDPVKRAEYDAEYENQKIRKWRVLSAAAEIQPNQNAEHDNSIRYAILSFLYAARRKDPENPDIGMWRLEQLLGWPEKEINFNIWYLKEKKWIYRSDSGGYAITVSGAEEIEARRFYTNSNVRFLIDKKAA